MDGDSAIKYGQIPPSACENREISVFAETIIDMLNRGRQRARLP
jgi:hypothetical protein